MSKLLSSKILSFAFFVPFCFSVDAPGQDRGKEPTVENTVCDILKDRKRFKNKEVTIRAVWEFAMETSRFLNPKACANAEFISAGKDGSFERNTASEIRMRFETETDLLGKVQSLKPGLSRWCCVMRIEIVTKGIFLTSNKKRYGHLEQYKHAFQMTALVEFNDSKLIEISSPEYFQR